MRFDELKNQFPETPDFIHVMIQDEVAKQLGKSKDLPTVRRRARCRRPWRVAAVIAACILAASTVVYAGTRMYHMYLEKKGSYSVATGIGAGEEGTPLIFPEKIHDIEITAEYIPEGMGWMDAEKLSYTDTPSQGGISLSWVLMDEKDLGAVMTDTNVVESKVQSFGEYEGVYLRYQDLKEDKSFNQRIYMLCPEEYRVLTIYGGDDVPKEEFVKFAENIAVTEKDELIETKDLYTWKDLVNPETELEAEIVTAASDTQLPVHQTGDVFAVEASGEDENGNYVTMDGITARVDDVEIADHLNLLEGKEIPAEWKEAAGSDGKLLKNNLSYVKSGDGLETLDQVVKEISVNQKLVYVTVTYTNNTDTQINHMLYIGSLMLMKHEDGQYQVYNPQEGSGGDYDYIMGDGAAHTGEMTYFSVKEDYGNGGNYIASLKPGESIQAEMAWIVNENNLKDMYLNLNGTGSTYSLEDSDMKNGVVYIGK